MASKLKQLRTLVGEGVASDQELGDLLSRCGNSVQAAANAFFDQSRPEPRASHVERGVEGLKRGQRSGSAKSAPGAKKPRKVEAPSTADIARPPHLSSLSPFLTSPPTCQFRASRDNVCGLSEDLDKVFGGIKTAEIHKNLLERPPFFKTRDALDTKA